MGRLGTAQFKRSAFSVASLDPGACERELIGLSRSGLLTADRVVAHARNPKSALHKGFTWADTAAAQKWRLWEAQRIIKALVYTEETREGPIEVRVFSNVHQDPENINICMSGHYMLTTKALSSTRYRKQVLSEALREAHNFANKYRDLVELSKVIKEIDRL